MKTIEELEAELETVTRERDKLSVLVELSDGYRRERDEARAEVGMLKDRLSESRAEVERLADERDELLVRVEDQGAELRATRESYNEARAECERLRTFAAENFSAMIRQEAAQMREYGLSYEGVRRVLHEYNDGEISFGKLMDLIRAAARAMAEDDRRAASNLLAIIHGDGGHYEGKHGTVKACKDAEGVVSDLRLKLDAATYALGEKP